MTRNTTMGWAEGESRCRNHPENKQLQGVCAACLREKLSDLYLPERNRFNHRIEPAPVDCCYSSSPPRGDEIRSRRHKRVGSDLVVGPMVAYVVGVGKGLKKSKSIGIVARKRGGEEEQGKASNRGFWAKLILQSKGRRKNDHVLTHSKTATAR